MVDITKKASKICRPTLDRVSVINDNALFLEAKKNGNDYVVVDALLWSNQQVLPRKRRALRLQSSDISSLSTLDPRVTCQFNYWTEMESGELCPSEEHAGAV